MANKRYKNIGSVGIKKIRSRVKKIKSKRPTRALQVVDNGTDVIFGLNMDDGAWKGIRTSEMATDHEGRKILRWILKKEFDKEAQEIISDQLQSIY